MQINLGRGREGQNIKDTGEQESVFVWVEVEGIRMYSCYFSPIEAHIDFLQVLGKLEDDLIDTMGKLLERLLLQRLEAHIESRGGLSPRQYSFRKGRYTVDAIADAVDIAKKAKRAACSMSEIPLTAQGGS